MSASSNSFVTVVSGLPRSGTSMMMKMISAGGMTPLIDNIRVADDDNPKGYYEFEPVKKTKADPSWLKQAGGKVVKMVHLLLLDLPPQYEYRVLFMRRRLEEVIASQNVMLERSGKRDASLSDERVMTVFRAQIKKVDDWVRAQPNFRMMHVDYNEMLQKPAPAVQTVNEFLGGQLDTQAMLAVVDPALYRQRK